MFQTPLTYRSYNPHTKKYGNQFYKPEPILDPKVHSFVSRELNRVCYDKGWDEAYTQGVQLCLNQCEDPWNAKAYSWTIPETQHVFEEKPVYDVAKEETLTRKDLDEVYFPLLQTGQMTLEILFLMDPSLKGLFTHSTSYRNELNPVNMRHMQTFKLFEFETDGNMNELITHISDFLEHLKFGSRAGYVVKTYGELCYHYNLDYKKGEELTSEHERRMYQDFGPVVFITKFPEYTHPYWNMKRIEGTNLAAKVDCIVAGHETFGSAERSQNVPEMRKCFDEIVDGKYRDKLYENGGQVNIEKELDFYFKLPFKSRKSRCGAGVGFRRLVLGMYRQNILPLDLMRRIKDMYPSIKVGPF